MKTKLRLRGTVISCACRAVMFLSIVSLLPRGTAYGAEQKLALGFLLPLSGSFAAVGEDCRQGIEAALAEKGNPAGVSVRIADSKADPATALTEYRKMTDVDHVSGVFAFRGPVGMAINPVAKSGRMPLLGGVGNKDFTVANPFAFQLWPRSDEEGEFLAKKILERGYKRLAIATLEDDWTAAVSTALKAAFQAEGGTVTLDKAVLPADTDFKTLVLQLRNAEADAIFLNVGVAQSGTVVKQLREQRFDKPIFSNFWSAKKESLEAAGPGGSEGVMYAEMATSYPKLAALLQSKFGKAASGATLSSYAGALLMLQAAEQGGVETPDQLFHALSAQKELRTADGSLQIVDRQVKFPLVLRTIRNGVPVLE